MFPIDVGVATNLLGALALIGVGSWLLVLDHRRSAAPLLASLLISYGAAILLVAPRFFDPVVASAARHAGFVAVAYTATAVLLLSLVFPKPLFRWASGPPILFFPPLAAVGLALVGSLSNPGAPRSPGYGWAAAYEGLASTIALAIFAGRLLREPPGRHRRSLFLITLGAAVLSGHFRVSNLVRVSLHGSFLGPASDAYLMSNVVSVTTIAALTLLLLLGTSNQDAKSRALARGVAGALLVAALTGAVTGAWPQSPPAAALSGLWRFGFAVLIGWGILRHHLVGVDRTIRWGISKGTVAAAFVAVFFAATELAQEFFGSAGGSAYLGIVAAALLVFGLTPLHRAAERIAARASPPESKEAIAHDRRQEEKYRSAVRLALRDRRLSRAEERLLVSLAQDLGVDALRAYAIHDEILAQPQTSGRPRGRVNDQRGTARGPPSG